MSYDLSALVKQLAEITSLSLELAAISLLLIASIISAALALIGIGKRKPVEQIYNDFKTALTRSVLISLELLVIADLIATVAIDLTLSSLMTFGLLIVIRTILSLSPEVEIDGTWPWRRKQTLGSVPDGTASTGSGPGSDLERQPGTPRSHNLPVSPGNIPSAGRLSRRLPPLFVPSPPPY